VAVRIAAVVFDLDGVLIDSEEVWNAARREVALNHGGSWSSDAQQAMMGMSSTEWSAYMHDELGVSLSPREISDVVVGRLKDLYRQHLPLLPGATEAVRTAADRWPVGLASSANRPIIELFLDLSGLRSCFAASVSSEEVPRGKPAPDVYLEAAARLSAAPTECLAVEDSSNGIRSAAAAGTVVVAIPNQDFPPTPESLELSWKVLDSLVALRERFMAWAGGSSNSGTENG
jgi:HAD superfamily hydrolase (TIGR01509 family)